MTRIVLGMLWIGLMVLGTGGVSGQSYPNKPIRIVTSEAGGSSDVSARQIAQGISGPLSQPVIVENRPAPIAIEIVSKARPDGHTLLFAGNSIWTGPLLQNRIYDPQMDFSAITTSYSSSQIVVVPPSSPIKSVKELIALAKARPGELNYASGATGSGSHLAAELFKTMADVNIVRINYKGGAASLTAMLAAEAQVWFAPGGSVTASVKSGKLRALAVTSAKPSTLAPGLPTVASSGLPGYELTGIEAYWTPAKTPAAIINQLNKEMVRFLNQADVKESLFSRGVEVVGDSPAELTAAMKADIARIGKLIKETGIRVE